MVDNENLPLKGRPQYGVADISKSPIWNLIQREINRSDLKFQTSKIHEINEGKIKDSLPKRASEHTMLLNKELKEALWPVMNTFNQKIAKWNFDLQVLEAIQYTIYNKGGEYGWHIDSFPKYKQMINKDTGIRSYIDRKVSLTIFLNDPNEYEGGEFDIELYSPLNNIRYETFKLSKGSVIFFPSSFWHRVRPVTSGVRNVLVGVSTGASLTTGNDNIMIGKGADVSANAAANQITIGNDINAGGNNNFAFGKSGNVVTNDFDTDAAFSRSSDRRKKREIYDQKLGLDFINDLRTVNFQWKPSNEFPKEWNDYSEENNMDTDVIMHGFIAQEVKEALDKHSSERDSNFRGWKEGEDGMQHTSREMFVIPLIKAVQELSAQVDTLKAEIKELKNE